MTENKNQPKGIHEAFSQFFEQPTRPGLRKLLQDNCGEFDHLDFKQQWPDGPKLARDILGFANSSGGVMVVGVTESGDNSLVPDGLPALTDKTEINNSVKKFLPDDLDYTVLDLPFNESEYAEIKGKQFQVLLVEDRPEHLPFVAIADGDRIRAGMVYVRDGVATAVATHHQLQKILNRRIVTGHSTDRELTLKKHLDELKALYASIPQRISNPIFHAMAAFSDATSVRNPFCPKESFERFIASMIDTKKKTIEDFLRGGRQ